MSLLHSSHEATNLVNVLRNIELANNGYVFASSLCSSYLRRTECLVVCGLIIKGSLVNHFGKIESAYFTKKAHSIYSSIEKERNSFI